MNILSFIMACFSLLGALDLIFGNKFGLGKEFEKGLYMLGTMALSMIGMIVIAPLISKLIFPFFQAIASVIPFDPSCVAGSLFANDMGGAPLAIELALSPEAGYFNGLIVGAMMGATVSFTIPVALSAVPKTRQKQFTLGLMSGIVTIPVGCFVAGIFMNLSITALLINLYPLLIFCLILAFGLIKAPGFCIKAFQIFGNIIKIVILIGLACAIFEFLTGLKILPYTAPIQDGFDIIFNSAAVLTGAFPLVFLLSKVLQKPMRVFGEKAGINSVSAIGFIGTLASNLTTFALMEKMDEKGAILNSAFAVSAAWVFADHLAFTLAFNAEYVFCVILGKLIAGISSLIVANLIYKKTQNTKTQNTEIQTLDLQNTEQQNTEAQNAVSTEEAEGTI